MLPIINPPSKSNSAPVADIVIYGATFSGIIAACSANKNGGTAIIIEPRYDIGGMVTGGVQYTDSQFSTTKLRSCITGLTNDFYAALAQEYGYGQQDYFANQNYSAESKRARAYLDRLMRRYNVVIYPNNKLTAVTKSGTTIVSATFDNLGVVTGKVFIDATYSGDMMAMAGCSFTVGREAAATYSESALNAGTFAYSGNQPTNPIDPYVTPGVPASGLIPFVQPGALNATGSAESTVMAMGMRLSITDVSGNKVAVPAPANYDPTQYELLRRHATANGSGWTTISDVFNIQSAIPTLPNGANKRDANHKGFMSLDYVHPESTEYATATWARRAQIDANIVQYTLGLWYFLTNDTSIPAAVRTNVGTYALCADEYQDNGGMPKYPYQREGRRMIGDVILKGSDLSTLNGFNNQIAQAYYLFDSHPCQYLVSAGKVVTEGGRSSLNIAAVGARIPKTVMYPKVTECTNLIVTWSGSMSHIAFCANRMEPISGCQGEAAGVIAVLAVEKGIAVQSTLNADMLKYTDIFGWNNYGGSSLSSDGTYADGVFTPTGTWGTSATTLFGTTTIATCSATSATNSLKLQMGIKETGMHDIYIKWSDTVGVVTRGSPTVTVTAMGVTASTFVVNESNIGDGGDWFYVGRYMLKKGDGVNNYVTILHDNSVNPTNFVGMKCIPARNNPLMKKVI